MSSPANISIRPYALDDIPRVFEATVESKEELGRWMPWCHANYSMDDSRQWVESQVAAFPRGTEYEFVITSLDNRLLGGCGINHLDRLNLCANLGYWVRSSDRGRGVAVAAVKLLVDWAFANTDFCRLEVLASAANMPSQRVAEKAGADREGVLRSRIKLQGRMHDAVIYSFVRSTSNPPGQPVEPRPQLT
jgi:RimJ/RimL family protein N-acetyltransferase